MDGGFTEYALVRTDFIFPLPAGLDDVHVATLLCAGIIGLRSLRVAGVEHCERVGLFGCGSSASLAITILEMRRLCSDKGRSPAKRRGISRRDVGRQGKRKPARVTGARDHVRAEWKLGGKRRR